MEELIKKQINLELYASHVYRGLGHYFLNMKIGYGGYGKFFMKQSREELEHSDKFVEHAQYLGFYYSPENIEGYSFNNNFTVVEGLELALKIEKDVLKSLINLHDNADIETQIFTEDFIEEQKTSIIEISTMITRTKTADNNGLLLLDGQLR